MSTRKTQLTIALVTIAGTLLNTLLAAFIDWIKTPNITTTGTGFYASAVLIILSACAYLAVLLYFTRGKK